VLSRVVLSGVKLIFDMFLLERVGIGFLGPIFDRDITPSQLISVYFVLISAPIVHTLLSWLQHEAFVPPSAA
jgi:hypothetical protein